MAKKKQSKVLIKESGANVWISRIQLLNRLKKGKRVTVSDRSKDKVKEYKKDFKEKDLLLSPVEKSLKKRAEGNNYQRSVKSIEVDKDVLKKIKESVRRKNHTRFTNEFYATVYNDYELSGKSLNDFLRDFSNKYKEVSIYLKKDTESRISKDALSKLDLRQDTIKGNFHYQTTSFIDRLKIKGNDVIEGEIVITDYAGNANHLKDVSKALRLLKGLNAVISDTVSAVNNEFNEKTNRSITLYVTVAETITKKTGNITVSVKLDYTDVDVVIGKEYEDSFNATFALFQSKWIEDNYRNGKLINN